MSIRLNTTSRKILASAALLGTAAAVAGLGTFGGFTSSTSASTAVDTGTTTISIGGSPAAGGLSIGAAGLVPGDRAERLVTLSNTGTTSLGSITLTAAPSVANALSSDKVNGLKLTVESCANPWNANGNSYTCTTGATPVLSNAPIAWTGSLGSLESLNAGKSDNLRVIMTLPGSADNTFQGLKNTIAFTFDATQRASAVK